MKRTVVPTAPLERAKWQAELNAQPKRTGWLVLTLVLSLAAGFAGALAAQVYQLEGLTTNVPDLVIVPDQAVSAQAQFIKGLEDEQAQSVVTFGEAGVGLVVSSDGWVVTASEVITEVIDKLNTVTVTTNNGKTYTADQVVPDAYSKLTYVHVPSTGLRPAEFREEPIALGETAVGYAPQHVAVTYIGQAQLQLLEPRRTDALSVAYASDRPLALPLGTPLFDSERSVLGLLVNETTIVPITAVNEVVFGLFSAQEIQRPGLTITYNQSAQGAEVLTSSNPLLKPEDNITDVNTTELTEVNDLSNVLAQSDLGDTVTFDVIRENTPETVQFVLQ